MDLLSRDNLLWALAAVVVLLLYVARWAPRRDVSASFLWQRALARRSAWLRWRRIVSAAFCMVIAAVLGFTLGQPFLRSTRDAARSIVLIVDVSASMKATDVAPNRFAAAIVAAKRRVRQLGQFEQMAVVSAGNTVDVKCGFTGDPTMLIDALENVAATDGANGLEPAIALGQQLLAGKANPRIVVFTDRSDEVAVGNAIPVQFVTHAAQAKNIGVTKLAVRASLADPHVSEVLVETRGCGAVGPLNLELVFNGQPISGLTVDNRPQDATPRIITAAIDLSAGGLLVARLKTPDDLAADNEARLMVPPRGRIAVDVPAESHKELKAALRAVPRTEFAADRGGKPDVIVLYGTTGKVLPDGPTLVVAPVTECDLWSIEPQRAANPGAVRPSNSPVLAGVDLEAVAIDELIRLQFRVPAETLAETASGVPVATLLRRSTGAVLVLHVPLDKSDLLLRPSFPLLIANAIHFLAAGEAPATLALRTADTLRLPGKTDTAVATSPDGRHRPVLAGAVGPFDEVGLWTISGTPDTILPVNLLDPRETDLTASATAAVPEEGGRARLPWWHWLAGIAAVLLVVEWGLYQRKTLE